MKIHYIYSAKLIPNPLPEEVNGDKVVMFVDSQDWKVEFFNSNCIDKIPKWIYEELSEKLNGEDLFITEFTPDSDRPPITVYSDSELSKEELKKAYRAFAYKTQTGIFTQIIRSMIEPDEGKEE